MTAALLAGALLAIALVGVISPLIGVVAALTVRGLTHFYVLRFD